MEKGEKEFKLESDFIELDNLLKAMNLVASGPEAKRVIREGLVYVNTLSEKRVRRKLRRLDSVGFKNLLIKIV